jgi:hypothetical protein
MRWVNIGPERMLDMAHKVLQGFILELMERRKKTMEVGQVGNDKEQDGLCILSSYITDLDYSGEDPRHRKPPSTKTLARASRVVYHLDVHHKG